MSQTETNANVQSQQDAATKQEQLVITAPTKRNWKRVALWAGAGIAAAAGVTVAVVTMVKKPEVAAAAADAVSAS